MTVNSVRAMELPPNPGRTIDGLRDTGYQFESALADIVDNSIAADADHIKVTISRRPDESIVVTVIDDGHGMNQAELENAMTYGSAVREDLASLGKFGMGLKTASTAFCRRLEVVTRAAGDDEPICAVWDIDHVIEEEKWELLLPPVVDEDRNFFDEFTKGGSGTFVAWRKVDRLAAQGSGARHVTKLVKGFKEHVALVYQRFLDPEDVRERTVEIVVNGEPVKPFDPFLEKVGRGDLLESVEFIEDPSTGAVAVLRFFVLPTKEQLGTELAREARLGNLTQGVYIYREGRLIDGPHWFGLRKPEPHMTLLRAELSFDHRLDDWFNVDIKKSRVLLGEDERERFRTIWAPHRDEAERRYRAKKRSDAFKAAENAHDHSSRSIGQQDDAIGTVTVTDVDEERGVAKMQNRSGETEMRIELPDDAIDPALITVQAVDGLDAGVLWEPRITRDGRRVVRINSAHPYYERVYLPHLDDGTLVQSLDSMLWGLAFAEIETTSDRFAHIFELIRDEVSEVLRRLALALPVPAIDDEDA